MYGENEPRNRLPIMSIIAAIFFGAGSLWAGAQGVQLAFGHSRERSAPQLSKVDMIPAANNTANILNSTRDFKKALSDTTSFIEDTVSKAIPLSSPPTTILIGGDIMLDRKIRSIGQKKGYDYLFASLSSLFRSADIVIANLEGPVTTYPSKTLLPNGVITQDLTFTFAPSSIKALANAGITAVSLANNHEDNFGAAGVTETKQWLKKSGIKWFGSPWNTASTSLVLDSKGMKIAFVGYHAFQGGIDNVLAQIRQLTKDGNFVIVMPHWGPEYTPSPTVKMRTQARSFIAAGAKAVIGSHPHVIMSNETIAGVPVYYSVGNLIFDQYFSDEVLNGEIVKLELVNGPGGPSLDNVVVYGTKLDRVKGVVLK